jgi:pyruvate/2-oxoglutarate dehydrogenase complex dihydrolipoamide dehydrogenase (E3) component
VAIVATGSTPVLPPVEGADKVRIYTVEDALLRPAQLGSKVLIIGGGGIGAEVADYLSESGKEVTLVEMKEAIALDLVAHLQHFLGERLKKKGVRLLTSTKAVRFEEDGLWVEDPQGARKLAGFDSIVTALGSKPNDDPARILRGKVPEVHVIGDASKPREVMEAFVEGEEIALKI